jgi:hypothetical protein
MITYDKRKKYFITLDTETIGVNSPLVYDLGYAIHDKKGNIILIRSFLVKETWENDKLMRTAYYSSKIGLYHDKIKNNIIEVKPWLEILSTLHNDLHKYKVHVAAAYNLQFDMRSMQYTHKYYGYRGKILPYKMDLLCIWGMACETVCQQKMFYEFCDKYKLISPAGNYKTSAEIVYRYLTNNIGFIEEHTGLADVMIEIEILSRCIKYRHTGGIIGNCWKIAQKKES